MIEMNRRNRSAIARDVQTSCQNQEKRKGDIAAMLAIHFIDLDLILPQNRLRVTSGSVTAPEYRQMPSCGIFAGVNV